MSLKNEAARLRNLRTRSVSASLRASFCFDLILVLRPSQPLTGITAASATAIPRVESSAASDDDAECSADEAMRQGGAMPNGEEVADALELDAF